VLTPYLRPPGQTEDSASYQTNVLADLAESFVLAHRDDAAPFYLEVMPLAPHAEHCADAYGGQPPAPDSFESRIRPAPEDAAVAVPAFVPGAAFDEDIADKPDWLAGWPALTASDRVNIAAQYQHRLRSLLSVDRMLGRIVAALGPAIDDTVLLFTSDNGWLYGEHRASSKIYAYRESARVPLYVALPGASAPQARANLVLNNDLAPTLLEIAAPGYGDAPFDGRSLAPILLDPAPPGWQDRSRFLIEYARSRPDPDVHPSYAALRSWNLLYIESYAGAYYSRPPRELIGLELYDLVSDPHEMNSIVHFPENPRDSVLGSWLDLLSTCAGESCRQYENAQSPP
jgi:arylsulfatase A-like enzyme